GRMGKAKGLPIVRGPGCASLTRATGCGLHWRDRGCSGNGIAMSPRDLILVLLIAIAWAGNFLFSANALREIPPFLFTALRFALLALPLLYWLKRPAKGQWPRLIAVCLCIGVVHFGLSFAALKMAGNLSSPAIVLQS